MTSGARLRFSRSLRLMVGAALVTSLVVGGAGASFALWSSTAGVSSTATTATVGASHALGGSTLAHTYGSNALVAAGVVTVTNSSTRAGTYSMGVSATSTSTSLRSAVAVEIGTASTCSITATLSGVVTGTLNAPVTKTGSIAAGASVALCVRTTMTAAGVAANPSTSLSASIASSVLVGTWNAAATPALSVTQSVAAAPLFTNSGIRYTITNQSQCVARGWDANDRLVRGSGCGSNQLSEWQFVPVAGGAYAIASAHNTANQPNLRMAATTQGTAVAALSADLASQHWLVTVRPDGLYRIVSVGSSLCLTVGTDNQLGLALCDNASAAQGYSYAQVGNASAPPVTLTCSTNGSNYIMYSWPRLVGYEAVVTYKAYIDGVFVADYTNGWSTQAQMYTHGSSPVLIATYGSGTKTVEIRQSISGGQWTTTGTAPIVIQPATNNLLCG